MNVEYLFNRFLYVIILCLFLNSCDDLAKYLESDDERIARIRSENSLAVDLLDSLINIDIDLPVLIDSSYIDIGTLEEFNKLASATNGKMKVVASSTYISKVISQLIKDLNGDGVDFMFIIDRTGSMSDDIENINAGVDEIIEELMKYDNVRVSLVTYGDKNVDGRNWYTYDNFEQDINRLKDGFNGIEISGGGDYPESVNDGLFLGLLEGFFEVDRKHIGILLGDAPSLQDDLTEYTLTDILAKIGEEKLDINYYPIIVSPQDMGIETGIKRMERISIIESIYPNPNNGIFSIYIRYQDDFTIEIYNSAGVKIFTERLDKKRVRIDLFGYPLGTYVVRTYDDNKNFDVNKIIIN